MYLPDHKDLTQKLKQLGMPTNAVISALGRISVSSGPARAAAQGPVKRLLTVRWTLLMLWQLV